MRPRINFMATAPLGSRTPYAPDTALQDGSPTGSAGKEMGRFIAQAYLEQVDTSGGRNLSNAMFQLTGCDRAERRFRMPRVRRVPANNHLATEAALEPNQKQLSLIGELLAAERLRPVLDTVVRLSRAPQAYAGQVERTGRGKVVVAVPPDGLLDEKEEHAQECR